MTGPRSPVIFYLDLGLSQETHGRFVSAVRALPDMLRREPLAVSVSTEPLPQDQCDHVRTLLANSQEEIADTTGRLSKYLLDCSGAYRRLIVGCREDDVLAKRFDQPEWWGGNNNCLSVCWRIPDEFVVWHEALHLLGAKDCYDESGRTTCELPKCIMQYVPCRENVGDWSFLCSENIQRVKDAVSGRHHRRAEGIPK